MPYDTSWSIKLSKIHDQKGLGAIDEVDGIDAIAEACLAANELVKAHGTPEMEAIMRVLLFQIGKEIARQQVESRKKRNGG